MMTEEKAKKILDFIASKSVLCSRFRCNKIGLRKECDGNEYRIVAININDGSAFHLYAANNKHTKALTCSKCPENVSMKYILNEILKYTEKGYSIKTYHNEDMMLPAYATLEQIEIMMDLDNENDK